jgi:serine/threonine protein kinase
MGAERIGRYEILAKIGEGAMGVVYRAHDPVLNRDVAVKTITAGRGEDETLRKRFQREARAAAQLSHRNIVTVFELGEHDEQLFMAMELLEGTDLRQAIHSGELSLPRRFEILEKICEGLSFAHANDIVHRDLKPANIHLGRDGSVKIMDFGLARFGGSSMTRTGMVMGTPHYMSPEQVRGGKADARSDVFALGALAYELLTGRKPFDAETMHAVLFKVMQEEPPPAQQIFPQLPPVIIQVVEKALAKDPAERFADAGGMLKAVRKARQAVATGKGDRLLRELRPRGASRAAGSESSASGSQSRSSQSGVPTGWSPLPWILAAAALVVVVFVGIFVLRGGWRPSSSANEAPTGAVQDLANAVVETQVELARRRLDAGDFSEAASRAERALKLEPGNKDAQDVLAQAQKVLDEIESAASRARDAAKGGDAAAQAEAVWALMQLDPSHEVVKDMAPGLGEAFRPRAEEARRLMSTARDAAEAAGASRLPEFVRGTRVGQEGQRAFGDGDFGTAARDFLEARDLYERAGKG